MPNTFWGVVTAAVVVSIAHVVLPSHWLPFVLVGRTRGWSAHRVLAITATAGVGHAAMTSLLGLLVAAVGIGLFKRVGEWSQLITAGVLIVVGGAYLVWAWRGGHELHHFLLNHDNPEQTHEPNHYEHIPDLHTARVQTFSDRAAFWSLFSMLTFSPCEGMVPFFFASVGFGWTGLLALAAVTGVLTAISILALVSVAWWGLERVRLPLSERGERILTGVVLMTLGTIVLGWH